MYFIVGILISIFIFGVILMNLVKIVLKQQEEPYKKLLNIALYFIAIITLLNIVLATISFFKTKDKVSMVGDRGMKGTKGIKGSLGYCNTKCGQKVCYIKVTEHLNKYFNNYLNKRDGDGDYKEGIRNEEFKDIINKICSSDKYMTTITQKHPKKPPEDKLIKYLEKTIEKWVDILINYNTDAEPEIGIEYLKSKHLKFDDIKVSNGDMKNNPLSEIGKYDIYNWYKPDTETTRLKNIIKPRTLQMPKPDEPKLFIMKTNNYTKVYDTKMKKDIWDTRFCNYNQMGDDASNPNNIKRCIHINPDNKLKEHAGTWRLVQYKKPSPLTLYNVDIYKDDKNQIFYPVGSVWTCQLNINNNSYKERLPKSKNFCGDGHGEDKNNIHTDSGPEKETILVSGDVVDPINYKLLWDSKKGCKGCQEEDNGVKIYRPIAPKGYIALGDVAIRNENEIDSEESAQTTSAQTTSAQTTSSQTTSALENLETDDLSKLKKLKIKCVPDYCIKKMSIGPMVWNNEKLKYLKFNSYSNYTQELPYFSKKQVSCTLWSAGATNINEENRNNLNYDLDDDGGYNLFRIIAGKGFNAPPNNLNSYKIMDKYLLPSEGNKPKDLKLTISNASEVRYNDNDYFGEKPNNAIITNIDTFDGLDKPLKSNEINLNDHENEPKRFYLIDDTNQRKTDDSGKSKPDTYFLKTYSKNKKDYSACIICSEDGKVHISDRCDKSNDYHIWQVKYYDSDTPVKVSESGISINLTPKGKFSEDSDSVSKSKSKSVSKYLRHYYDSLGKGHYILTNNPENDKYRFRYDTFTDPDMPKQ